MKDRFQIFQHLIMRELSQNHFGCTISVGQLAGLMGVVEQIHRNWDDSKSVDENVSANFERSISPLSNRC